MATVWYDFYAGCPFYQKTDGKEHVYCEGICGAKSNIMEYDKKEKLMIQLKTVCCRNFWSCKFYQLKMQIYEDDDNG